LGVTLLSSKFAIIVGLLTGLTYVQSNASDKILVFSTPPTQSPRTTIRNYQPMVDYISDAIGEKIVIDAPKNFQEYTKKMREGKYDLIFDGPHFIKWRIEKQDHVVIAKQPGELHFVIVVKKGSGYRKLRDLWGKRVCSPAVPHLGTLTLLNLYNPLREPRIVSVQSFKHALQCLKRGQGSAALVRDKFWIKTKVDKSDLELMYYTRRKMPARGLTVNHRVSKAAQIKITQALTSKKGRKYAEKAFSTIGGGRFVKAEKTDYKNQDNLINIVWGFHK